MFRWLVLYFPFLGETAEAESVKLETALDDIDTTAAALDDRLRSLEAWKSDADRRMADTVTWVQGLQDAVVADGDSVETVKAPRPAGYRWVAVIASQPPGPGEVVRASELQELQRLAPGQVWVLAPDVAS